MRGALPSIHSVAISALLSCLLQKFALKSYIRLHLSESSTIAKFLPDLIWRAIARLERACLTTSVLRSDIINPRAVVPISHMPSLGW